MAHGSVVFLMADCFRWEEDPVLMQPQVQKPLEPNCELFQWLWVDA